MKSKGFSILRSHVVVWKTINRMDNSVAFYYDVGFKTDRSIKKKPMKYSIPMKNLKSALVEYYIYGMLWGSFHVI